jgi:hypothetical protein
MIVELWGISETPRFRDDVLHYQPSEASLKSWRDNIQRDPMIGQPVEDGTGIGEYDYAVGDLVIRYIVVPQQRHVVLMMLRHRAGAPSLSLARAGKVWQTVLDVVGLWNGVKWW